MPKLEDEPVLQVEPNKYLEPGQAMLIDQSVYAQLKLLAIDGLFSRKTPEEIDEELAALAGSAMRNRRVVLIKNIGKESGNHGKEEKAPG
jgi:hypothetical protein